MSKSKARILVVALGCAWTLRVNLEARGYDVLTVGNGQTAVELAASKEPDLIILDVNLPGLNG